jgi:dipeptidyl aminopeptidase/acylaminoacyl peptidase
VSNTLLPMTRLFLLSLTLARLAVPSAADEPYRQPPPPIARILDAEPRPAVRVSPDNTWLLLLERHGLPPIAEVAASELRLAGARLNPRTNGRSREQPWKGLRLVRIEGEGGHRIETSKDARLGAPLFSADAKHLAFTVTSDEGIALWVAEVATGKATRLTDTRLNGAAGDPCHWISKALLCRTVPAGRVTAPTAPTTPIGPVSQESDGKAAPNPTYQDLLQNAADEATFEHYFTSQLVLVSLDGASKTLGPPALHTRAEPSPDGTHLFVETLRRPFSYLVPWSRFPWRLEVWDLEGKVVREVAEVPLQEQVKNAIDAVPVGPREVHWRADAPATLVWTEALDGGDPDAPAVRRDRLRALAAPFAGDPVALADVESRISEVTWARADLALVEERWWKTRRSRTSVIDPARPGSTLRTLFDRSSEDRYRDPGRFVKVHNLQGMPVLLTTRDRRSAFLMGEGASPEGDRPFVDRLDLQSGKATRLFRSEAPHYEQPLALLDAEGRRVLTWRESVTEPPNVFWRDTGAKQASRKLTDFPDPAPELAGVKPELLHYSRADGVQLSATLYLPPGHDRLKGPLPFLFWAYPQEFKSKDAASQVSGSPFVFTRPSGASHLFLLTQGYAILDDPTMPIVGEGDREPNDTYVEQLVTSASAAVDKVVGMGLAERGRIAIGGHSYGAFMTANLLAHSNLFRAGIARSGAYNRSLTPFGFQAEERTFWKARDIYVAMSPFTYADKIDEPILLTHGMADNNTGTFPLQTERLYAAIKGNGGKARLVMLPAESHGYRARESVGHTLAEMVAWLETWVKNAPTTRAEP